jgi:LPS export ABC transporter protein LptC
MKNKNHRLQIYLLDLFMIFLIGFLGISCEDKKKESNFIRYNGPTMTTDNMVVMLSDSGKTKIKFTTARQLKYQNEDEFYPKAVYVTFFDKNGVEYSSLRGDSGRYHKSEGYYEVMGNVFFFNRLQQQSLNTEQLNWSPIKKIVYTNKKVVIKTHTDQITGIGLEADQDFTRYQIKRVTGTFAVDSLGTPASELDDSAVDTTSN